MLLSICTVTVYHSDYTALCLIINNELKPRARSVFQSFITFSLMLLQSYLNTSLAYKSCDIAQCQYPSMLSGKSFCFSSGIVGWYSRCVCTIRLGIKITPNFDTKENRDAYCPHNVC